MKRLVIGFFVLMTSMLALAEPFDYQVKTVNFSAGQIQRLVALGTLDYPFFDVNGDYKIRYTVSDVSNGGDVLLFDELVVINQSQTEVTFGNRTPVW